MISDGASASTAPINHPTVKKSITHLTDNIDNHPCLANRRFIRYSTSGTNNKLSNIPVKRYTDRNFEIQTGFPSLGRNRRLSDCILGQELATPRVHDLLTDNCMAPKKDHGGGGERIGLLASPADLASRFDETLNRMTPVSSVKKMTIEEEENSNEREMENEAIANSLTARADEMLNHFATTQPPTRRHFSRYSAAVHPSDAIRKTNEAVAARTARRRTGIGNLNNEIEDEELGSPINQELIDGVEMVSDIASSPSRSDNITMTPAAAASAAGTPSGQKDDDDDAISKSSPPTFKRRRSARLSGSGKRSRMSEN